MSTKLNITDLSRFTDHKAAILDAIGDVGCFTLLGSDVLVAIKPDADRSKGGIIFTDKKLEEARWQGKVGLIIAMGPTAFKYDPDNPACAYEGRKPKLGDWVVYYPHESREIAIRGTVCRIVSDKVIRMTTTDPDSVY